MCGDMSIHCTFQTGYGFESDDDDMEIKYV